MKKETWVIVANSSLARLFILNGIELTEMSALVHPESRMRDRDLVSDQPGHTYGKTAGNSASYATTQQTPPKKVEEIQFAKQVVGHLESARSNGKIDGVYLAAGPAFLGLIRQESPKVLLDIIKLAVSKDITHMKKEEIRTYFPIGL